MRLEKKDRKAQNKREIKEGTANGKGECGKEVK